MYYALNTLLPSLWGHNFDRTFDHFHEFFNRNLQSEINISFSNKYKQRLSLYIITTLHTGCNLPYCNKQTDFIIIVQRYRPSNNILIERAS